MAKDDIVVNFESDMHGLSSGYGFIDYISGVPGMLFPKATIIELFGPKSSSKTTLILETIAYNQFINPDFKVLYVDYEKMLRKEYDYLRGLGIDVDSDRFQCITPSTMQEGCQATLDFIRNNKVDLVVIDTVAAMRPQEEIDNKFGGTKQMGLRGKLMSEFCRNLMADLEDDGPAVIFINQMFRDISSSSFIPQFDTPASESVKFYSAIRIEVKEKKKLKEKHINPYTLEEDDIPVGSIIEIKTHKNKVGRPFLVSRYMLSYGYGIDMIPSMISAAIKAGIIYNKGRSKSVYLFKVNGEERDESINGMANLITYFRDNPDIAIAVGSQINDLWFKEMERFAIRKEIKHLIPSLSVESEDDFNGEDAESLDLDGVLDSSKSKVTPPGDLKLDI